MDAGGHFISRIFNPEDKNSPIKFDNISYILDDKRFFLIAGAIHYARIPKEEWEERIILAKECGLNTIQTYIFWHSHEPQEGVFKFDDYCDIEYFIQLVKKYGLKLILRIGPYVNAERDNGGFPKWLAKYNCKVRVKDEIYLEKVLNFWKVLFKKIKKYTISAGGPIIIIQYENEVLWKESEEYLEFLRNYVQKEFKDVILVESGMYHEGALTLGKGIDNLYHNTELWMGWLYRWGDYVYPAQCGVNTLAKIYEGIAGGVDGFTYYVFSGTTNFDYSQSAAYPTCYELGEAPLDEQGKPTRLYYELRLINNFIKTFENEIITSKFYCDEKGNKKDKEDSWACLIGEKTKFFFGYNSGNKKEIFGYPLEVTFSREKPVCFVFNFISQGVLVEYAGPNVLYNNNKILVLYADQADDILLKVFDKKIVVFVDSDDFYSLMSVDGKFKVLVMSKQMAKKTIIENDKIYLNVDVKIGDKFYSKADKIICYDLNTYKKVEYENKIVKPKFDINLKLEKVLNGIPEIDLENEKWQEVDELLPLDYFVDTYHDYAWYRLIIESDREYTKVMHFEEYYDQMFIFFNKCFITSTNFAIYDGRHFPLKANISLNIKEGINYLDILLKSWGRYKGFTVGNETLFEAKQVKYFKISNIKDFNVKKYFVLPGLAIEYRKEFLNDSLREIGKVYFLTFKIENKLLYDKDFKFVTLRLNISKTSLTHGVLWLNNRNIGRYYNKGYEKIRGYNLPKSWLVENNTLIIYEDLDGSPENIQIDIKY